MAHHQVGDDESLVSGCTFGLSLTRQWPDLDCPDPANMLNNYSFFTLLMDLISNQMCQLANCCGQHPQMFEVTLHAASVLSPSRFQLIPFEPHEKEQSGQQ